LIAIGVVLWVVTVFANRATQYERTDPDVLMGGSGPTN